eukprot:143403-Pyramimonas_sp.AAC.1
MTRSARSHDRAVGYFLFLTASGARAGDAIGAVRALDTRDPTSGQSRLKAEVLPGATAATRRVMGGLLSG